MANEKDITQTIMEVDEAFTKASQEAAEKAKNSNRTRKGRLSDQGSTTKGTKPKTKKTTTKKSSGDQEAKGPTKTTTQKEEIDKSNGTMSNNSNGSSAATTTLNQGSGSNDLGQQYVPPVNTNSSSKVKLGGAIMIGASLLSWIPLYNAGIGLMGLSGPLGALAAAVLISAGATALIVGLAPKIINRFRRGYAKWKAKRAGKKSIREQKWKNKLSFLQKAGVKLPKIKGENGQALDWDNLNFFQKRKFVRFLKKHFKNGEFVKVNASLVGGKPNEAAVVYKIGPDKEGNFHLYSPISMKALNKNEIIVPQDKLTPETYQEIITDQAKIADIISNERWTEPLKAASGIVPENPPIKGGNGEPGDTEEKDPKKTPGKRRPKGTTRRRTSSKKMVTLILPNGKKVKAEASGNLKPGKTYYADVKEFTPKKKTKWVNILTKKGTAIANDPKRKKTTEAQQPRRKTQIDISKKPLKEYEGKSGVGKITITTADTVITITADKSEQKEYNTPGVRVRPTPAERLCVAQNIKAQDPNCSIRQTKLKDINQAKAEAKAAKAQAKSSTEMSKVSKAASTTISAAASKAKQEQKQKSVVKVQTKKIEPSLKAKNKKQQHLQKQAQEGR